MVHAVFWKVLYDLMGGMDPFWMHDRGFTHFRIFEDFSWGYTVRIAGAHVPKNRNFCFSMAGASERGIPFIMSYSKFLFPISTSFDLTVPHYWYIRGIDMCTGYILIVHIGRQNHQKFDFFIDNWSRIVKMAEKRFINRKALKIVFHAYITLYGVKIVKNSIFTLNYSRMVKMAKKRATKP